MADLPLNAKGKRTQFFDEKGVDSLVTMSTELMTELWVLKERFYVLEKVLEDEGINVSERIENLKLSSEDQQTLETKRRYFVETIMRAFDADWKDTSMAKNEIDQLTESMTKENNLTGKK